MLARSKDAKTPPHLVSLVLVTGVGAMVLNIFTPALKVMSVDFDVSDEIIQLSVTGYLFGAALAQILIGPLSDRFGRRRVLQICYGIFILASLGCALSQNFGIFMMFRLMQCAAVSSVVISRATVRDMVEGERAASMIAYVSMGMSLVPMLAPSFGGLLGQALGWRAIFWFMALAGLLTSFVIFFDYGETKFDRADSIRAQFKRYPELFVSKRFWGYTFVLRFSSGMFFSYLSAGSILGANVYQLNPSQLGVYLGFAPFGYFFGNWISGRYARVIGIRRLIYIGIGTALIGFGLAIIPALLGATAPVAFYGFTVFIGFGNGMVIPSANAGMLDARPDLAGTASGLSGAFMIGGGGLLAQMAAALLALRMEALTLVLVILLSALISLLSANWTFRLEALREKEAR